jgi:hypothetical protein
MCATWGKKQDLHKINAAPLLQRFLTKARDFIARNDGAAIHGATLKH